MLGRKIPEPPPIMSEDEDKKDDGEEWLEVSKSGKRKEKEKKNRKNKKEHENITAVSH